MEQMSQNNNPTIKTSFAGEIIPKANRWINTGLGKIPPQAIGSEVDFLGMLISKYANFADVSHKLKVDSFYKESHQKIFAAMVTLFENSSEIDLFSLQNQLGSTGELEAIGGKEYLFELAEKVNSAKEINTPIQNIINQYLKRQMIDLSCNIQKLAYEEETNAFELLNILEQRLNDLTKNNAQ